MDGGTIPPRHESGTKISVGTILAATGPKADFGACQLPVSRRTPSAAGRIVTGGMRAEPRPSPHRRNHACGALHRPRPSPGSALIARRHDLRAGGRWLRRARQCPRAGSVRTSRSRPHGCGAWHRCTRNARSCRRSRSIRTSSGGLIDAETPAEVCPAVRTPTQHEATCLRLRGVRCSRPDAPHARTRPRAGGTALNRNPTLTGAVLHEDSARRPERGER